MNRAYSLLTVTKAADEDQRVIEGVASTPIVDRMDDIVEPKGAEFKLPLPLLLHHDSRQPIGHVTSAKITAGGIVIKARIAKVDEPGTLKDRLDEAWSSIKAGLIRGLSIGFKAIETSRIEGTGGIRFIKWSWLELSAVTIPANADASIATIKSLDTAARAASGHSAPPVVRANPPASGAKQQPVTKDTKMAAKSIAEQISAFDATRAAKDARMSEIMDAAAEKGETLDEAQKTEYDELAAEVKSIDEHLVRLRDRQNAQAKAAKPVDGKDEKSASESRDPRVVVTQVKRNIPEGIPFVRVLGAKYLGRMNQRDPAEIAKQLWPETPEVERVLRAPVAVGTTSDATWAAPLVDTMNMASEFAELLKPATIIGRIPGLRRVPFNIRVPRATTGASVNWVGEGKVKPVSSMAFDSITLAFTKVAGIVPITQELMRFSNPAAEGLIRDELIAAIAYLTDRDFLDPTKAEAVGVSPASITNGVTPITATGTTADALRADLGSLLAEYAEANMNMSGLVLVMTAQQAIRISLMRNTLGNREFEGLGPNGGMLEGIPVVVSENIVATGGSPLDGGLIVAINAPEILLADDGGVDIDVSTEASLQMETSPDSPATASTTLVSLWQHNMVGIRAERFIHWKKRRDGAVQFIQNAKYS